MLAEVKDEFLSVNCRAASTVQELQPHSFPGLEKLTRTQKELFEVESHAVRTACIALHCIWCVQKAEKSRTSIKSVLDSSAVLSFRPHRTWCDQRLVNVCSAHLQVLKPDEAAAKRHHAESAQTLQQTQEKRQLQVREEVQRLGFTHAVVAGAHQAQHLEEMQTHLQFT